MHVKNSLVCSALVGAVVLGACGIGESVASFDSERACRVGQRLVDETAAGDRDGAVRQIERLADLDGIEDSSIDVDELDALAERLNEQAVDDLVAEFEAIDCVLQEAASSAPPATDAPPTTAPPLIEETPTIATTEAPVVTEPAAATTDPPQTTEIPETTEVPQTTGPVADPGVSGSGTSVDIGSTGPGAAIGLDVTPEEVLSSYAISNFLFSPNTNVAGLRVSRTDSTFGDDVEYSNSESITMTAATTLTIEEVRTNYRAAIEGLGVEFDYSESTSSSDGINTVAIEASPSAFDLELGNWDVTVSQDAELPGVVVIEVNRLSIVPGVLPEIAAPAQPLLQNTATIGTELGWTVTAFTHSLSISSFSGDIFESGRLEWDVSEENTVRATADALQAAVGVPVRDEDVDDDRISWFLDDGESTLFAVNYFEFSGTTATFNP